MIPTTLVLGSTGTAREQAIAGRLQSNANGINAVLLEGLAHGDAFLSASPQLLVVRIAAGCLCCSNEMILRVYLNRLIHQKPQQLFLSLSTATHLPQLLEQLTSAAYAPKLKLMPVLNLDIVVI